MVQQPGLSMQYALRRATDAAEKAANANTPEEKETWTAIESGWLRLATDCDLVERIDAFTNEQNRDRDQEPSRRNAVVPYNKG